MKNSQKLTGLKTIEINPKAKILDAAVTIFSQNGFEGARTRDIADLAQVNISTLHYHFKSKDNIYGSVIQEINSLSNKYMMPTMIAQKEIIANSKNKKQIVEAIKVMAITFVETITQPENKRYSKIIAFEQIEQSKHFKTLFENVMKRVCEPFLLAVAKITGKKINTIEVILLTHTLHGVLTSFQHNKSSLLYLSGWNGYDDKNTKHIKKHILRTIDHLFEPYL
jgi:TetR/AcrR family transcriptional regulator, regulator of cefoperazone and chloramphenicol sensitivity